MLSFLLAVLMFISISYLRFCFLEHLRVRVYSRVPLFFPDLCIFTMVSFSICTFQFAGICFCGACRQLLDYINIEKSFIFVADIVFRARCFSRVFAVSIKLNLVSVTDYVRFPVVAAAPTPISLMEPYVYICFHPLY